MSKLIKFYSKTCGPCKVLENNLKQLNIEYDSVDINTDEGAELSAKYNIRNVPTLLLVDDSNNEIKKNIGILSVDKIKEFLNGTN